MKIIATPHLVKQFRFPRSKRKRIRRRWEKRARNFRPDSNFYVHGETILCHPAYLEALEDSLRRTTLTVDRKWAREGIPVHLFASDIGDYSGSVFVA